VPLLPFTSGYRVEQGKKQRDLVASSGAEDGRLLRNGGTGVMVDSFEQTSVGEKKMGLGGNLHKSDKEISKPATL